MSMQSNFQLDFLGIGTEKSGTSWIANCLMEHPEINLPKEKELFFWNAYDPHYLEVDNLKYETLGIEWYKKQFGKQSSKKLNGEFTPTYIYCETAAKRIREKFPNIKFIIILRNPTQRAFSQYIHDKKIGLIKNISFEKAIESHENYLTKGLYSKFIKIYLSNFPRENFFITTFDEMVKNPEELMTDIYSFLSLNNTSFVAKSTFKKANQASSVKFSPLNYFMMHSEYFLRKNKLNFILNFLEILKIRKLAISIRNLNTSPLKEYPEIKNNTFLKLKKYYLDDVVALENLLNLDLSSWK
jgi:hypothetical protein